MRSHLADRSASPPGYKHQRDGASQAGALHMHGRLPMSPARAPSLLSSYEDAGRNSRPSAQTCFGLSTRTRRKTPSDLLSAERAFDASERSTAELRAPGASRESGGCKHQSSSHPAGGRAAGIGQTVQRRVASGTGHARPTIERFAPTQPARGERLLPTCPPVSFDRRAPPQGRRNDAERASNAGGAEPGRRW